MVRFHGLALPNIGTQLTAIVGVRHNGSVYLGADSRITDGWLRYSDNFSQKVWQSENWGFAISGSLRGGQLLKHFNPPRQFKAEDLEEYLVLRWAHSLATYFEKHKFHDGTSSLEVQSLLAVDSRLFKLFSDFSIVEYDEVAGGSGEEYALGSLNSTKGQYKPETRVRKALEAAAEHSAGVGGEVFVKEIKNVPKTT